MGLRFNPAPGWPPTPEGFTPQPGWQPDPSWPPAPPGWQLWVDDGQPAPPGSYPPLGTGQPPGASQPPGAGQAPGASQPSGAGQAPGTYRPPGAEGAPGSYAPPPGPYGPPGSYAPGGAYAAGGPAPAYPGGEPGGGSSRASRRKNRLALRLAGLGVVVVVAIIVAIVSSQGHAKRSSSGQISHKGNLSVFDLKVGDCFNNPTDTSGGVASVQAIPCTQPHNAQIYAKFTLTAGADGAYPGDSALTDQASKGCSDDTQDLNQSALTNSMTPRFLVPEEDTWNDSEHTASCMVVNPTATLTSSLLNG